MQLNKILTKSRLLAELMHTWPKGTLDFVLSSLSFLLRTKRVWGYPTYLTIEPSSICNLRCPLCETGVDELNRAKCYMTLEQFKQIVDQVRPFANTVMLYFMGESFLNPHIYEMINYLKRSDIFVTACTNGDVIDPAALVASGMDEIVFQLGGVTQENHVRYRKNSQLDRILGNIREVIRIRSALGTATPIVKLGFIIMRHNEHEVPAFFELAKQLGVDHAEVVNTGVRTYEQAKEYLPSDDRYWNYSPEAFNKGILTPRVQLHNSCSWIYYSSVITVNGDVVPCCRDPHAKHVMGNVFEEPFLKIWNNQRYKNFRNILLTRQKDCNICNLCWGFGVPLPNDKATRRFND